MEYGNYGDLKSEMIQDLHLTLEVRSKEKNCQCKAIQAQQEVLEGAISNSLEEVKQSHPGAKKPGKMENHSINMVKEYQPDFKSCSHCGKIYPRGKCPAKEAICRCCQRKGHYSAY